MIVLSLVVILSRVPAEGGQMKDPRRPGGEPSTRTVKILRLPAQDDNCLPAQDDNCLPAQDDTCLTAQDDNCLPAQDDTRVLVPD